MQFAFVGVAAGISAGTAFYVFEALAYSLCCTLERWGLMHRFCPDAKRLTDHSLSNIIAVGLFYCPLYWLAARQWDKLAATAVLDLNPIRIFGTVWLFMVLHDCWFFFIHSALHRFKPVYMAVHARHHELGSNVTAYGTAFGEALDYGLCICLFHLFVYLYLRTSANWSPIAVAAAFFAEVSTDISGHCGYEVPYWLNAGITLGVGTVTPGYRAKLASELAVRYELVLRSTLPLYVGFASSKLHYIHHLDPRFNRSLYFTWWDRVAGTHKDTHPLVDTASSDAPHRG